MIFSSESPDHLIFLRYTVLVDRGKPMDTKEEMKMKKLYRSNRQRMIAGVCGGIAEYFHIDPTLVRLGFVALAICCGSGVLAYLIATIVIPGETADT